MSIFSIVAASSAPERTVSANGYRFTTTQVERLDAELLQLGGMIRIGHIRQDAGMDMRIQGLDATVKAFGGSR